MDRRIELVTSKIKRETATAWDITTLATMVNLSPSRFRHLFKQETGTSPAQWIKEFRLRKAEKMLRTTFLSVKQVLKQVGLGSNTHFVHDFRKKYGMTPTTYRRPYSYTCNSRFRQKLAVFDKKQSLTRISNQSKFRSTHQISTNLKQNGV